MQSLAFQTVADDENLADKIKIKLVSEIAGSAAKMVDGQQLDLDAEGEKFQSKIWKRFIAIKPARLFARRHARARSSREASQNDLTAVTNYASKLGLLFQVTDDLLDITQTTAILGKTAGKDLTAEKATYPALYGVEETKNLAEKIHAEACAELKKIEKNTDILRELVDFILHRET